VTGGEAGLVERMLAALERRRASGEPVTAGEAAAAAAARMVSWEAGRAIVPDDPWLAELGLEAAVAAAGVEVVRWPAPLGPRELLGLDGAPATCGVTVPAAAVAERGTLVLESGPGHGRALDVIGPFHLALLPASRLVDTLAQALGPRFRGRRPPSAVSLVSGPSRTSDIEKISTLGAHGALSEHVLIVVDA
jgi:L-lactate dehydrogenase complex protein LldG